MQLTHACLSILNHLEYVLNHISDDDYSTPSAVLSHSTVGQHMRHTLEFFICLEHGFQKGIVNYDKRAHDRAIESDKNVAINALQKIKKFVTSQTEDVPLKLEVGYERHTDDFVIIDTNYLRELTYNIEHAVHHMAIMKIGIRDVAEYVKLPADFGVAVSTLRHQEAVQVL